MIDPGKVLVVYNGIDTERYAPLADRRTYRRDDAPLLEGMIAHLAPIKGQEDFVRAAARIVSCRDDVNFLIIGEDKSPRGENRKSIERLIAELRLCERVRLCGWVDDVLPALSVLSLFVSPARVEPFGLMIVEAMASGLPVVATMSEGAREIIKEGFSGKLVPVGHIDTLAKAISALLDDRSECERLGQNARRTAYERFSLARMARETEIVYQRVTRAKVKSRCS